MPLAEVTVTAYSNAAMTSPIAGAKVTTTETGTFSVKVPTLSGTVYLGAAPRDDYDPSHPNFLNLRDAERYTWFDPPATSPGGQIAVIPGQILQFGTFTGNSVQPRITSVRRSTIRGAVEDAAGGIIPATNARGTGSPGTETFLLVQGEPTDTIFVTWHYETRNAYDAAGGAAAAYSAEDGADAAELRTGSQNANNTRFATASTPSAGVTTPVSAVRGTRHGPIVAGTGTNLGANAVAGRGTASAGATVRHDRVTRYVIPDADDDDYRNIKVRIGHAVIDADGTARANTVSVSDLADLAGVTSGASGVMPDRDIGGGSGGAAVTNEISASWSGDGSPQLETRIALYVQVETGSTTENRWEWVVAGTVPAPTITRDTDPETDSGADWAKWNMDDYDLNLPANAVADGWVDDDAPALLYTVSQSRLRAASHLRVDTRVDDGGRWAKGTPVAIPPS